MELKTDDDIKDRNLPTFMNEEATRENLRAYRHWLLYDPNRGYVSKIERQHCESPLDACRFTFDQADDYCRRRCALLMKVPAPEVVFALQATWVVIKKFERLVASGEPWSPR